MLQNTDMFLFPFHSNFLKILTRLSDFTSSVSLIIPKSGSQYHNLKFSTMISIFAFSTFTPYPIAIYSIIYQSIITWEPWSQGRSDSHLFYFLNTLFCWCVCIRATQLMVFLLFSSPLHLWLLCYSSMYHFNHDLSWNSVFIFLFTNSTQPGLKRKDDSY